MSAFAGNIIVTLLLLTIATIVSSENLHELMTPDELAEVYQTVDGSVPNYEVVPIHWPKIQKRHTYAGSSVYLKAFGSDIKLFLNPTDGILAGKSTPIYSVKYTGAGPKIAQYKEAMKQIVSTLYEDLRTATTFSVTSGPRGRRFIGNIGESNLAIRPIPERLAENITRYRRSIDGIPRHQYNDHHYHIVYKTPELPQNAKYLAKPLVNSDKYRPIAEKQSIPDTVYPEILVIVDHSLYKLFQKSIWKAIPYLLAFWNGVDMKYRNLVNPKYRLNIAGILIAEDENALEYIRKNKWDSKKLIVNPALTDSKTWLYKLEKFIDVDSYDVAVTMTSDELCTKSNDGECLSGTLGLAYVSGTCKIDKYWKEMSKTMIVQDKAGYDGIHTAAHELGHSLGAHHDGTHHTQCRHEDGHIMAGSPVLTENSSDFSPCTLEDFQEFLNSNPTCIYNKPSSLASALPRYLPGKILDANGQCKKLVGTDAYVIDDTICRRLKCWEPNQPNYWTEIGSAAAEGTKCGAGKMCLHGQCLHEREI